MSLSMVQDVFFLRTDWLVCIFNEDFLYLVFCYYKRKSASSSCANDGLSYPLPSSNVLLMGMLRYWVPFAKCLNAKLNWHHFLTENPCHLHSCQCWYAEMKNTFTWTWSLTGSMEANCLNVLRFTAEWKPE